MSDATEIREPVNKKDGGATADGIGICDEPEQTPTPKPAPANPNNP
jgi:hypothetical protein